MDTTTIEPRWRQRHSYEPISPELSRTCTYGPMVGQQALHHYSPERLDVRYPDTNVHTALFSTRHEAESTGDTMHDCLTFPAQPKHGQRTNADDLAQARVGEL